MSDVGEENQGVNEENKPHPESVSWTEHVGLKEKFNRTESKYKEQVTSLEEQLKIAPNAEEFGKTKEELEKIKGDFQKVSDELKVIKDSSLTEKREYLKAKGVPEDKVVNMSEESLVAAIGAIESYKPKPDMSGGGGGTVVKGNPMELARQAYTKT